MHATPIRIHALVWERDQGWVRRLVTWNIRTCDISEPALQSSMVSKSETMGSQSGSASTAPRASPSKMIAPSWGSLSDRHACEDFVRGRERESFSRGMFR